jgi:hypothetical protein
MERMFVFFSFLLLLCVWTLLGGRRQGTIDILFAFCLIGTYGHREATSLPTRYLNPFLVSSISVYTGSSSSAVSKQKLVTLVRAFYP